MLWSRPYPTVYRPTLWWRIKTALAMAIVGTWHLLLVAFCILLLLSR